MSVIWHQDGGRVYADIGGTRVVKPFGTSAWASYCPLWDNPKSITTRPGVYVVYLGFEVAYVGSSRNLRSRICQHCSSSEWAMEAIRVTDNIEFRWKQSRAIGDWLALEYRLINRLKPRINKANVNHEYPPKTEEWWDLACLK